MPSRPLLYICARPQRDAARGEYASFAEGTGLGEALHAHDLVRDRLPDDIAARYAGVVVGGSPFNVTDAESDKSDAQRRLEADLESLAHLAADGSLHALFTCYGIGVVTRMLGGTVSREHPEDTGPTTIHLSPAAVDDALFAGVPAEFAALTAHKEGSATPPAGVTLLAENAQCPVQAYRYGTHLWATQFHPEPTPVAFTQRMTVYRDAGYFDAADYDTVAARVLAAPVEHPASILRAFASHAAS